MHGGSSIARLEGSLRRERLTLNLAVMPLLYMLDRTTAVELRVWRGRHEKLQPLGR